MPESLPIVDVVGVGLNATDTLVRLPHFPAFDSKVEVRAAEVCLGGTVARATVACQRWGLRTRYVGKVGDDDAAGMQRRAFEREGVEAHLAVAPECRSQSAFILVDDSSGERTILWNRDVRLELRLEELLREWVMPSKALLVDGHDTAAASAASRWAREARIPVVANLDNLYPGVEVLLENVDYLVSCQEFPPRALGEKALLKSLPRLAERFGLRIAGATLGRGGALAWNGSRFIYSPAYQVRTVDTTGAGDIFHGAFLYRLLQGWPMERILDVSCAAAALNCTAIGARGGIRPIPEILQFMEVGERHPARFRAENLGGPAKY